MSCVRAAVGIDCTFFYIFGVGRAHGVVCESWEGGRGPRRRLMEGESSDCARVGFANFRDVALLPRRQRLNCPCYLLLFLFASRDVIDRLTDAERALQKGATTRVEKGEEVSFRSKLAPLSRKLSRRRIASPARPRRPWLDFLFFWFISRHLIKTTGLEKGTMEK